jgi:hypothetical protein
VERALCEEFAEVLGLEVGITDSFSDAGGHSLMATKAASRISRRLGCSINVFDIFQSPTIGGLAQRVMSREEKAPDTFPWYMKLHSRKNSRPTIILFIQLMDKRISLDH